MKPSPTSTPSRTPRANLEANLQASLSRLSEAVDPVVPVNFKLILDKYSVDGPCLDVGCGRGQLLRMLTPSSVGIDYIEENCRECCRRHENVVCADANGPLPFRDEAFSCLVCSHVLEHLTNPYNSVLEMRRLLISGGYLIIALPTYRSIARLLVDDYFADHPSHIHAFDRGSTSRLLVEAGFEVCEFRIDVPKSAKSRLVNVLQKVVNVSPRLFWGSLQCVLGGG